MEEINEVSNQQVPEQLKKWSWGAFMFNILWGIGHKTYLPLLCFIPVFNLVWIFVCGCKGNQWAWKKGNYSSVEEFFKMQESWNRAGRVYFIIGLVIIAIYILGAASIIASLLK